MLETLIDGAHGIDIHAGRLSQLAQTGETLARPESPVAYLGSQRPCDLDPDRHFGVAVDHDAKSSRIAHLEPLGHALTIALR